MKRLFFPGGHRSSLLRGFTLVEILVAFAVLALIILVLGQITAATSRITILSDLALDSAAQSRLAFDRIGLDLGTLVNRSDVDFYVRDPNTSVNTTGSNANYYSNDSNTLLLFLTSVNSYSSSLTSSAQNRSISLVAYQVSMDPDNTVGSGNQALPCLIRAGKAIPWAPFPPGASGPIGYIGLTTKGLPVRFNSADTSFAASLLPQAPSGSSANDYDILASGVICIGVGFQLYPDNLPVTLNDATSSPIPATAQGQIVYSVPLRTVTGSDGTSTHPATTATYVDLNRVSAVVIGLVVLDKNSLKLLTPANVKAIASKFSAPSNNQLFLQSWTSVANGLTSSLSGSVPLPALQSVRVYQRFFPLTPFPTKHP